jgi:hypothetical protein
MGVKERPFLSPEVITKRVPVLVLVLAKQKLVLGVKE